MSLVNVIFHQIMQQIGHVSQSIHVHTIWGPVTRGSQFVFQNIFGHR